MGVLCTVYIYFCVCTVYILQLLFSQYNDRALAHTERVCANARYVSQLHLWQETPTGPNLQGGSRDEASLEATHQEEETLTILDGCRRRRVVMEKITITVI
jgi:hypothetical protein